MKIYIIRHGLTELNKKKKVNGEKVSVSEGAGLTEIRMGSLAGKSWEEMEDGLDLKQKHRSVQFDYRQYRETYLLRQILCY